MGYGNFDSLEHSYVSTATYGRVDIPNQPTYTQVNTRLLKPLKLSRTGNNHVATPPALIRHEETRWVFKRVLVGVRSIPQERVYTRVRRYGKKRGKPYTFTKTYYKRKKIYKTVASAIPIVWFSRQKNVIRKSWAPNNFQFTYTRYIGLDKTFTLGYYNNVGGAITVGSVTASSANNNALPWGGIIGVDPGIAENSPFSTEFTTLESKAVKKLYEKVHGKLPNYAQVVAERSKTIDALIEASSKLLKIFLAIKKGNIKKAADLLGLNDRKVLANNHLLWTYGLAPTIGDIQGIMGDLKAKSDKPDYLTYNARAFSKREQVSDVALSGTGSYTKRVIVTETCKVTTRLQVPRSLLQSLQIRGLTNPLALGWELMPWSFVIDWFIDIGGFIANFGAFNNTTFLSYHVTKITKIETSVQFRYGKTTSTGYITKAYPSWSAVFINVNRSVRTSYPALPTPKFDNGVSFRRTLNFLALLTQLKR